MLKSCLISAILYRCEAWFSGNIRSLNTRDLSSVKAIHGVRLTTPNVTCMMESGFPTLNAFIINRLRNESHPFIKVLSPVREECLP